MLRTSSSAPARHWLGISWLPVVSAAVSDLVYVAERSEAACEIPPHHAHLKPSRFDGFADGPQMNAGTSVTPRRQRQRPSEHQAEPQERKQSIRVRRRPHRPPFSKPARMGRGRQVAAVAAALTLGAAAAAVSVLVHLRSNRHHK